MCQRLQQRRWFSTRMERSDPNITEIYAEILNLNTKIISRIPFIIHPTVAHALKRNVNAHTNTYPQYPYPNTHTLLCATRKSEGKSFIMPHLTKTKCSWTIFPGKVCKWSLTWFEQFNCVLWVFSSVFYFLSLHPSYKSVCVCIVYYEILWKKSRLTFQNTHFV